MGIEQLVDAFKGNPQPLQAKVQQAQKGQPPGAIPPDLEEAIALQKITELRNSAQNQQAMQAGGAQPSVVEKLRQMLSAEQRQQAQPPQMPQGMPQGPQGQPPMPQGQPPMQGQPPAPQGQPVMAAGGGSIAQLMSNLGRHYAGGGIVAFNGEDESSVEDEEIKKKLQQYTLQQQGADYVARKQAARLAEAEDEARRQALMSQIPTGGREAPASTGRMSGEFERNLSNTLAAMPGASVMKAFSGSGLRGLMGLLGIAGDREEKPAAATPPATLDAESEKLKRLAAVKPQTGQSTNPDLVPRKQITGVSPDDIRPAPSRATTSGVDNAPMPSGLASLPSVGVGRDYERKMLAENQKFDPEAYKAKFLQEVGPRDLSVYDEMAAELKARKERLKNPEPGFDSLMEYLGQIAQSGGRNWMESGARGAAGVKALQKERQAQQDALVDKILDIGSKKKEAQYNERLGLFNLTKTEQDRVKSESKDIAKSLGLSEDKEIEQRQQMTIEMMKIKTQKEIEASRAASRGAGPESKNMANAINAVKNDEVINRLQKRAEELGKSMLSRDRSEAAGILKQIEDRQNAIYKQFGVLEGLSTMAAAPGAASPGGTRPPLSSFQR
jgi:hypothetical protein